MGLEWSVKNKGEGEGKNCRVGMSGKTNDHRLNRPCFSGIGSGKGCKTSVALEGGECDRWGWAVANSPGGEEAVRNKKQGFRLLCFTNDGTLLRPKAGGKTGSGFFRGRGEKNAFRAHSHGVKNKSWEASFSKTRDRTRSYLADELPQGWREVR